MEEDSKQEMKWLNVYLNGVLSGMLLVLLALWLGYVWG